MKMATMCALTGAAPHALSMVTMGLITAAHRVARLTGCTAPYEHEGADLSRGGDGTSGPWLTMTFVTGRPRRIVEAGRCSTLSRPTCTAPQCGRGPSAGRR